jgi:hypothetical protein
MEIVYHALEPHSSLIAKGAEERERYFVEPWVLEALAWVGIYVLLPFLIGVASQAAYERIRRPKELDRLKALELTQTELNRLKNEVENLLRKLERGKPPTDAESLTAQDTIAVVLEVNGWPSDLASEDAKQIVVKLVNRLWPPSD